MHKTTIFVRLKARASRLRRQGVKQKLVTISKKGDERLHQYMMKIGAPNGNRCK